MGLGEPGGSAHPIKIVCTASVYADLTSEPHESPRIPSPSREIFGTVAG
jgi:hypothetical protein